jgi:hypothetical protein
MEVDFWGVWNAQTFLRNSNFIPKKKLNERQSCRRSNIFRLPFLISQQKRFLVKFFLQYTHTERVGKNNFFILSNKSTFLIENFISQRCKMIATKWKWNEHKFHMKKFQSLDIGALILWRAFGLTEISQIFCYEIDKFWWIKGCYTTVTDEFLQALFFISQSLFLTFSVYVRNLIKKLRLSVNRKNRRVKMNYCVHSRKNGDFLTSFSLSNKSTYLAYKISYRKISEINVKAAEI